MFMDKHIFNLLLPFFSLESIEKCYELLKNRVM